jgi:hypothetical protein
LLNFVSPRRYGAGSPARFVVLTFIMGCGGGSEVVARDEKKRRLAGAQSTQEAWLKSHILACA